MEANNSGRQSFDLQRYSWKPVTAQIPNKIQLRFNEAFRILPGPIVRDVQAIWVGTNSLGFDRDGVDDDYDYEIGNWYLIHEKVSMEGLLDNFVQYHLDLYLAVTDIGEFYFFPIIVKSPDCDGEDHMRLYKKLNRICHDVMIQA